MSVLGWESRKWSSFAETDPMTFLSKLENMKAPTRALKLENYLECIVVASRILQKHNNTEYETRFFKALQKLLPNEAANRTASLDVSRLESRLATIDSKRDPIGMLLWKQDYSKRVALNQLSEKVNYHRWFLGLKKEYFIGYTNYDSNFEKLEDYNAFSTLDAPAPFKEYVEWQRTGVDTQFQQWLLTAPLNEAGEAYRSLLILHRKDETAKNCIENAAKSVLLRLKNEMHTLHLSTCVMLLYETITYNDPSLDEVCANLCFDTQVKYQLLHQAWFGKRMHEYSNDSAQAFDAWWERLNPTVRAAALTGMLAQQPRDTFWNALTQSQVQHKAWCDVFTKYPVSFSREQQYAIVENSFERTSTLEALRPIIPMLVAAELAAGDKWRTFFLENMRPNMRPIEIPITDSSVFDI